MRVSVLASGSAGNATFVQLGGTKLLVDAGISARRIRAGLAGIGVAVEELSGVLITHEHRDHIGGLAMLAKKYALPVYARPETFRSMALGEALPAKCRVAIGDRFGVGGVKVEAFNIPHDAADPVGFSIYGERIKCTVATDLGFVTSSVQKALDDSDVLVLEANHDVDLLERGSYPRHLKRRIMSNRGHLSNYDAAWALVRMKKRAHTKVFLAHLSERNNRPEVARDTVRAVIERQGCDMAAMDIRLTKPDEIVSL